MKTSLLYLALIMLSLPSFSQNLVPNGSFEDYTICPVFFGDYEGYADHWLNPNTGIENGTPDYFNSCATGNVGVPENIRGNQEAFDGQAYCGIVIAREETNINFREYIEVELVNTLEANKCYNFSMRMSLADVSKYTCDQVSVYFSDTLIYDYESLFPLNLVPQIENETGNYPDADTWIEMTGSFIATGTENFMLIGNFKDAFETETIVANEDLNNPIAFFYLDAISLEVCQTDNVKEFNEAQFKVFPVPSNDFITIESKDNKMYEVEVYNSIGQLVRKFSLNNSVTIDISLLANGIYTYSIINDTERVSTGKFMVGN